MKNHLRVVWGAFALLVAMLIAMPVAVAGPSMVFKAEGVNGKPAALRLFDEPCTNKTVRAKIKELVREELQGEFRRSRLTWDGRDWESCWMQYGGNVYSLDEEGSQFQPIPMRLFREDSV